MNQTEQMREVVQDSLMESAKAVGAQIVQMVIDGKGTLGEQVIIFSVAQLNDLAEAIKQAIAAEQAPVVAQEPVAFLFPERDTTKPAEAQGLFRKFDVRRVDGSDAPGGRHYGCSYFVIDMNHDAHAGAALRAYADACKQTHPELSAELTVKFGVSTPAVAVNEQFFNDLEVVAYENHLTGHIMEKMDHQRSSSAYGSYNVPLVRLRDIRAAIAEAVKKGVCDGLR